MKKTHFGTKFPNLVSIILILMMAVPMTLIPSVAGAVSTTIFSDGFEPPTGIGNWIESGWSSSSDGHGAGKSAKLVGANNSQTMRKTISTVGYDNLGLSFWYKADSLETQMQSPSYHFDKVELLYTLDGSNWTEITSAQIDHNDDDNNWRQFSFSDFPSGANNNSNFGIKFDGDLSSGSDTVWIDDVSLTGTSIPTPVNGGWSEWSPLSCPTEPGSPESQLTRTCTNPTPAYGGSQCEGEATQVCPAIPVEPKTATIVTTKIVCDSESDLPNWGAGDSTMQQITEDTADDFLLAHPSCEKDKWIFEWAPTDALNPGDNVVSGGDGWTTIEGSAEVPAGSRVWVREQASDAYIPFSGDIDGNDGWDTVSAEMYCHTDVLNYDNYDWVDPVEAGQIYYCVGFNVAKEEPLICDPSKNLIENGSFENPDVTDGAKWQTFDSGIDWMVGWLDPLVLDTPALELHRGVNGWLPSEGAQYAELDGDTEGPSGSTNGESASTMISQNIPTIPGKNYKLTFDFSPRPNKGDTENVLGVSWGGVPETPISAVGGAQTSWTPYTFNFTATTSLTTLMFKDLGISNSEGTFLDNVSLTCVKEEPCVPGANNIVSDEMTMVTSVNVNESIDDTDFAALPVTVVPAIQALAADVWTADVGDTDAEWIWSNDPYDPNWEVDKLVTFSRDFTVAGTPGVGTLNIASDNSYEVYVNDTLVGSDTAENNHSVADVWDVSLLLKNGNNNLKVVVKNWALAGQPQENNPGGLLYNLSWTTVCGGGSGDPDEPDTLQVKIYKYLDGTQATAQSANNYEFPMESTWSWPAGNDNAGSAGTANYVLGLSGHGGSGPYQAYTSTMNAPALYQTHEITNDINSSSKVLPISAQCEDGKYRLLGYKTGDDWDDALDSDLVSTNPVFTNLHADKYVIVYNETCPVTPPPAQCSDSIDNDEDGLVDYPADTGCTSEEDNDEYNEPEIAAAAAPTSSSIPGGRRHDVSGLFGGGSVLGASTEDEGLMCEPYLKEYIKLGGNNNPEEVKKLQIFLNQFFELNNPVTGVYGPITFDMVKKFQAHQEAGTLAPWASAGVPTDGPTGYVYKTTKRWINILKCPEMLASTPIPPLP